ncbi:MAG TPA: hypothetical protein VNZ53_42860 [Steroidobacteraceae bacterium]|nr:hypothetical protein [Steroidobacteraceae bacterium]
MSTKSRNRIYGSAVRLSERRASAARKEADKLACEAWNKRMLGFRGPAQPSPTLGDALIAGYVFLEVRCLGCETHQTVPLDIVRRPKSTGATGGRRG